ncbi:MAG: hypothetical protein KIT45_05820 [Fimbriimonadia bacterium]|nr:hypothetical protein [Fimbriimonadia bacterium]
MRFRLRSAQTLFAYLLLKRYKPIKRAALIDKLFNPESEVDCDPMRALTKSVYELRKVLEPPGIAKKSVLLADRDSIALNPQTLTTDLDEFLYVISQSKKTADIAEKTELLQRAFDLYQGELLAGLAEEDWLSPDRFKCENLYEQLTCDLAQLYVYEGRSHRAEQTLLRALSHLPDSKKIARLHTELQARKTRVRTEDDSETVEIEPANEEEVSSASLPPRLGRYFGRHNEREQLQSLLSESCAPDTEPRLITLFGGPGIGKTRLSVEVGHALLPLYQKRVYFLSFAEHTPQSLLAQVALSQLPIQPRAEKPPLEQLILFLSQAPSLLILDNLEHLLESAAALIQTLLQKVPSLKCIATTRHPLGLPGEQVIELFPLGLDTDESHSFSESAQLFHDRVQSRNPTLRWTERRHQQALDICKRMEGIPLAIELAAARAASYLEWDRLLESLLEATQPSHCKKKQSPDRHDSMRAAVAWSAQLLALEVQAFLKGLTVFRGSWSADAAEKVCQEPRASEYLSHLRMHALINLTETDHGVRYHMPVVIYEYLKDQLSDSEWMALQNQHLAYFASIANPIIDYKKTEADHLNFIQAFEYAIDSSNAEGARSVGSPCVLVWLNKFQFEELARLYTKYRDFLLQIPQDQVTKAHLLGCLRELLNVYSHLGMRSQAQLIVLELEQIVQQVEKLQWTDENLYKEVFLGFLALANYYYHRGESAKARELFLKAKQIATDWKNGRCLKFLTFGWLTLEMTNGCLRQAASYCESYAEYDYSEVVEQEHEAYTLMEFGTLHRLLGDYPLSERYFERSLFLQRETSNELGILQCLRDRSLLRLDQARYADAKADLDQAQTYLLPSQDALRVSINSCLGEVALAEGDFRSARYQLENGLHFWRDYPHARWESYHLAQLGLLEIYADNPDVARSLCEEGLQLITSAPSLIIEAQLLQIRGLSEGEHGIAHLLDSLCLRLESGHWLGMVEGLEALAYHYAQAHQIDSAVFALSAATRARSRIGAPRPPAAQQFYAPVFNHLEPCEESVPDLEQAIQICLKGYSSDQGWSRSIV